MIIQAEVGIALRDPQLQLSQFFGHSADLGTEEDLTGNRNFNIVEIRVRQQRMLIGINTTIVNKINYLLLEAKNNQILDLPNPTHRAMTTNGSSRPVCHLPRSTRNNTSGPNILPNLKPFLIIISPATESIGDTKKAAQSSTQANAMQRRFLQRPEASGSGKLCT